MKLQACTGKYFVLFRNGNKSLKKILIISVIFIWHVVVLIVLKQGKSFGQTLKRLVWLSKRNLISHESLDHNEEGK